MMNAVSRWHQLSWPYGINFYGFRVKPTDKAFQQLGNIIQTATSTVAATHQSRGSGLFKNCGLDLIDRLHTFTGNLLTQLESTATPHALDFSGISDCQALAQLLGFGFPHANILSLAASARSTHDGLLSQQWGNSEAWLETNFDPLVYYQAQLVQGNFIDRNGTKLAFSLNVNQSAQNQPQSATNLAAESPQIAGELIYAVVEYLGDQEFQVPCYDPSTGQTHWQSYTCSKAGVITSVIGPGPRWTYTTSSGAKEDESALAGALIAYTAKSFEAAVKCLSGTLTRGVTVLGLNNEVIAEIIATALSVSAKKLMEAFTQSVLAAFIADANIDPAFKDDVFARLTMMLDVA
jgi:hypothetical protein